MFDKQRTYVVNGPYKTFIESNKRALAGSNDVNWCNTLSYFYTKSGMR